MLIDKRVLSGAEHRQTCPCPQVPISKFPFLSFCPLVWDGYGEANCGWFAQYCRFVSSILNLSHLLVVPLSIGRSGINS
jgi:hypothetical protein